MFIVRKIKKETNLTLLWIDLDGHKDCSTTLNLQVQWGKDKRDIQKFRMNNASSCWEMFYNGKYVELDCNKEYEILWEKLDTLLLEQGKIAW